LSLPPLRRPLWLVQFLFRIPLYWLVDQISRERFNRLFYQCYSGFTRDTLETLASAVFQQYYRPRLFQEGVEEIRRHLSAGRRVVLLTGSVEPLMKPLQQSLSATDLLATRLELKEGVFTGKTLSAPLAGARKREALDLYCRQWGIPIEESYAYGDSYSDLPMLSAVGYPIAVNPDYRLRKTAQKRGWEIRYWRKTTKS
jgi:fatty acyl-CoA reductase